MKNLGSLFRAAAAASCLFALSGCDPTARANGGQGVDEAQISAEHESCSSSLDCTSGLRCLDGVCTNTARSVLGDYQGAAGDLALVNGDVDSAIEHYRAGVNQYEAEEKLKPPPALYCSLGNALTMARADAQLAEEAARVLHRCLLGAPAGSSLRAKALAHLAVLEEVGLDPIYLARTEPADRYLTKEARAPSADTLTVSASSDYRREKRTHTGWLAVIKSDAVKAKLIPCWEAHYKETRKEELTVSLPFKYSYRLDDYDDFDRATLIITDHTGGGPSAKCIADVLKPLADEFSRKGEETTWKAKITIVIKPTK